MKNIILANFETFPVFDGFIEILRLELQIFCETISLSFLKKKLNLLVFLIN